MYVYFVRLTTYQLNTSYPQQLVTLTIDSIQTWPHSCHSSWQTRHSYWPCATEQPGVNTANDIHQQHQFSPIFLVSSWGCSTPRNTELPTPTIGLSSSRHDDSCRRNPVVTRADVSFISPSISPHHPWFWQLRKTKPQSRNFTCTRLHKTQLQPTVTSTH